MQKRQFISEFRVFTDNEDSTHHIRMAVQILGCRMHNHIDTQIERTLNPGRCKGIVAGSQDAILTPERGDSLQVNEL